MKAKNSLAAPVSLVTGGAGFIGSHVAENALNLGHKVVVLDDLSGGFERNLPKGVIFVKGSVNDVSLLDKLFSDYKFDYVYHLAAYAAEGLSHFIRNFNYTNNLIGSVNLINQSVKHNAKRFVFTSSIAVYGENVTPMVETLTPSPEDPYGISKYAVELDLKAAHKMFGLEYTIFRPHNVYGPKQNHGDSYRNVLGIFINQIFKKQPITIFGDGTQTRAFSYIDDVAPYIARCVQMSSTVNEIYNIGADKPYTILELSNEIFNAMGKNYGINFLPERNEVKHAFSDHSKARKAFKMRKAVSLCEGINKMVEWSKEIGEMQPTVFNNIEIESNMPKSWAALTAKK
ncbi:NAD-dependent epimerase/dehydratase family protein [candidate division WWE3 bacterium]|uniref:NAD-dependent epimerase/dehydratase family protein n=1 Tax=candidate division WWE3 bacterium TaxID=2053526 RepID=A0A7X9DKR9_UNCKA|nr:NAD-dependent epimerase/dehydratase family protein [candidate division WWE3 bacterium]